MRSFLSSDGEAIILAQAMDNEVIADFASKHIDYAKGPPSCTASHQAADRQSVFKDAKLAVRKQIEMEKAFDNQPFVDELTKAFNSLCTKFDIVIPAAYKKKLIFGAQHIVDALQNKAMTPEKVRKGYTICGQHLRGNAKCLALARYPSFQDSTVDFDAIMRECYSDISPVEFETMIAGIPQMVELIRQGKSPTDTFMDQLGIKRLGVEFHVDREDKVLWQQHALMITSRDSQDKFRDYLDDKNPETIARRKVAAAAQRGIDNAAKKNQRILTAAANNTEKAAEKAAEKARLGALSPASKRDAVALKKQLAAQAKADLAAATTARLVNFQVIVDAERQRDHRFVRTDGALAQVEIEVDEE